MKLNLFVPLPPAGTEIANNTVRALPAITARAEVVVWTEQSEWDSLGVDVEVRRYNQGQNLWRELNRADATVYHIGNNHLFHGAIYEVSRQHPGLVVLHDLCLHQLFYHLYVEQRGDAEEFLRQVGFYYGAAGRRDVAARLLHVAQHVYYLSEHYPLTPLALENSLGALVHSRETFAALRDTSGHLPLAYTPLPFPVGPRPPLLSPNGRSGDAGAAPYQLLLFGYIGRNRRLGGILKALAEYRQRDQFRLEVYGELTDRDHWAAQVRALGLESHVVLRGFVPEAELEAALASAHLALNLRFPTMGEASASQLRIWSHALPSLVSAAGWYASLPADAVAFVRPSSEIEDLHTHFDAFLDDPSRFAEMGRRGRELLEQQHTTEAYAASLLECARTARAYRPHWAARPLAARAGEEIAALFKTHASSKKPPAAGSAAQAIYELLGGGELHS